MSNTSYGDNRKRSMDGLIGDESSRRMFLKGTTALGISAAVSASVTTIEPAAASTKGGHFKVGMGHGSTSDTLDPTLITNGFQTVAAYAVSSTLTEVSASGDLVPAIATGWEASWDAKTWTFMIRQGVEFQNGKTLTAKDVVATINQHRGDDSKSVVKPIVDPIVSIEADGDSIVKIELNGPNADFPFNLDNSGFGIRPDNGDGGIDWSESVGCGAYVLKRFEPGVRAEFEKFPNYWRSDRGHADGVELLSIVDSTARTNSLVSGAVDVIDNVAPQIAELLSQKVGVSVEETSGSLHYTMPMRTDVTPFDDIDVRLALKYAVNREEMVSKILKGHGSLGNDSPIGGSYRYHASDIPQRSFDPDKAKFHMKKAGAEGATFFLSAADAAFAGAVDAAVLYKEHAAQAGINIEVIREPNDGYWSSVWMNKAWCTCYWPGYTTEDQMFSIAYAAQADSNDTFWRNDRFNDLLIQARAELDDNKRREMYREMQILVSDNGGALVPMFANDILARNNKVGHGTLSPTSGLDGRRIVERWWAA